MKQPSKFRGIDLQVLQFIQQNPTTTKQDLRREFVKHGEAPVRFALTSLSHKGLIKVKGMDVILLL